MLGSPGHMQRSGASSAPPNPSINRTSNSGLRPLSAAGYLERQASQATSSIHDHDHCFSTPCLSRHSCAALWAVTWWTIWKGDQQGSTRSYRQLLAHCPSESSNCSNPYVLCCGLTAIVFRPVGRFMGHCLLPHRLVVLLLYLHAARRNHGTQRVD
jgi:hypothetical protein